MKSYDDYTRVVFEFTSKPKYTYGVLLTDNRTFNNSRIYIDMENCLRDKSIKLPIRYNDTRINTLRYGKRDLKRYRYVLDINIADRYNIFELTNPNRLVIDLLSQKVDNSKSVITQTNSKIDTPAPKSKPDYSIKDDLLALTFSVFLQTNDLKNAYKTAKIALQKYPDSLYWHEQMAKVALWIEEFDDAHKSMIFIYKNRQNHTENFIKTLQSVAINKGDYATIADIMKKEILNGKIEKLNEFIYLETELLGNIDDAVNFLKQLYKSEFLNQESKKETLKHLIKIYYNLNETESVIQYSKEFTKNRFNLDAEVAILVSSSYFAMRNYDESLKILLEYAPNASDNETDFWEQLSDMSQFMNKKKISLDASMKLYKNNKAREVDIQRIIEYTEDKELKETLLKKQWDKTGQPYYAYNYLNLLIKQGEFQKALYFVNSVEKDPTLSSDIPFLLLKINLYSELKNYKKIKKTYLEILKISDSSYIKEAFLWAMLAEKDKDIEKYIKMWENSVNSNINLHYIYAAYFNSIQKYKLALYHLEKYIKSKGTTPSLLALYADILQAAGRDEEAESKRFQAYTLFLKQSKTIPEFLVDKENISLYLRLALYYKSAEEFLSIFKQYEQYLTFEERKDLHTLFMLKNNQQEHAQYLIRKYKYAQPWMLLNIALAFDDRDDINNLLLKHLTSLPTRDRVEAARRIGELYKAAELAFEGLEEEYPAYASNNSEVKSEDYELYKQYRDLITQYEDRFTLETSLGERGSLQYLSNLFEIKQHLYKSFYLNLKLNNILPSSKDDKTLINPPSSITSLSLEISKQLNDLTKIFITAGTTDSLKTYNTFGIGAEFYSRNQLTFGASYKYHTNSDETTFLYLGGMKNEIKLDIKYNLTPKQLIYTALTFNEFYSQDNRKLGRSQNIYGEYSYTLRQGYPDTIWRNFISYGNYKKSDCYGCVIGKLSPYIDTAFLPEDFFEIGTGVSIGEINRYGYTRVWRPFANANISYSNVAHFGYSFGFGIGGHIFNQDHLSLGFNYISNLKNTKDSSKEIKLIYRLWY